LWQGGRFANGRKGFEGWGEAPAGDVADQLYAVSVALLGVTGVEGIEEDDF
jgi:hypothetical protein